MCQAIFLGQSVHDRDCIGVWPDYNWSGFRKLVACWYSTKDAQLAVSVFIYPLCGQLTFDSSTVSHDKRDTPA
eukprot:7013140-Pyramimonas_sp.AAC.1